MTSFELLNPQNIAQDDISHLLVLGAGRINNGTGLPPAGIARIMHAIDFYNECNLLDKQGTIISSGYKTPAEPETPEIWIPELGRMTQGIPEAILSDRLLDQYHVPRSARIIEPDALETVTNLAYSRALTPDTRPLGIISQVSHLERILHYIAPRILRQPYVGIVAPEVDPAHPAKNSFASEAFTRLVTLAINPNTPNLEHTVAKRAALCWKAALTLRKIAMPTVVTPTRAD